MSEPINSFIGDVKNTKALEKSLKSMAKGERAIFSVKSDYAYGAAGNPELNIPPNTDLTFEIELVSFEKVKEDWGLSFEEKRDASLKRKAEGNELVSFSLFFAYLLSLLKVTTSTPLRSIRKA